MITLEHLIACVALLPWFPGFAPLKKLSPKDWFLLLYIACGVSVGGILCFTTAFGLINPAVVILLQKLQPIVTITLSIVFLRERIAKSFYPLAALAMAAGYVLVFGFHLPDNILHGDAIVGAMLALAATALWGSGTALGKSLLTRMEPKLLTRYRYFFGLAFGRCCFTGDCGLRPPQSPRFWSCFSRSPALPSRGCFWVNNCRGYRSAPRSCCWPAFWASPG
jgi:drug/metabolite transporter (DMT)-like permease